MSCWCEDTHSKRRHGAPAGPPAARKQTEEIQRCRQVLNEFYCTDYFTKAIDSEHLAPCRCPDDHPTRRCYQQPPAQHHQKKMVRSLDPPYWQPAPPSSTGRRPYQSNPFFFVKKNGHPPNPKPWESEHEQLRNPCIAPKTYVGHQADLCPLRLVTHTKDWDNESEMPVRGNKGCNLWHCRLQHKRVDEERPW